MNYTVDSLTNLAFQVLSGFGCSDHEAGIVANHLIEANLAGHDSHGIGMLPMYGAQLRDGNLIANQTPDFVQRHGAVSVVDARRGFGHRMTLLALDHAMETIADHGVAVLALRNSGHISRVGTYSEYCANLGYVSTHMVNVVGHDPVTAPFGSREGGYSTNPVSMAMPQDGGIGPVLDMATSTVALGKVRVAHNKGEQVPKGWLADAEGVETTDPGPMTKSKIGTLSAFGGHKGSGLGLFAELMAGALAGTNTVDQAESFANGVLNNMLSVILDPAAFDDASAVKERVRGYSDYIRSKKPAKGRDAVLLPGDPENISRAKRRAHGIPVDEETIRQILLTGEDFNISAGHLTQQLEQA
ncbi:MAG: Ldh family oxidoreductase [Rhizobiaceae bacterium]